MRASKHPSDMDGHAVVIAFRTSRANLRALKTLRVASVTRMPNLESRRSSWVLARFFMSHIPPESGASAPSLDRPKTIIPFYWVVSIVSGGYWHEVRYQRAKIQP